MEKIKIYSDCEANCSGHGECVNGVCFCEVQYDGAECSEPNVSYHVAFATIFLSVAVTSLVQLLLCIHSEYKRLKSPSLYRAFRVTTQKLLYFLVFIAAVLRGLYFAYPASTEKWTTNLSSAYYPVLLSGSSLVVCIWAEVFHLRKFSCEEHRFLSKSLLGFLVFNIMTYSLLVAELIVTNVFSLTDEEKSFYAAVFNGCYAALMLVVVIFFLIYGVRVYFKIHGGFLNDCCDNATTAGRLPHKQEQLEDPAAAVSLIENEIRRLGKPGTFLRSVDRAQLKQSRIGLVAQAGLLIFTICFLMSDVLGPFWRKKVPLGSRNTHDILFRVVEFGVALWFPCVLWNCIRPEQLWILNPKRLLKRFEEGRGASCGMSEPFVHAKSKTNDYEWEKRPECWICYDSERTDAGPLIHPCLCKGDVGAAHHECLRRWLIESANNPSALVCKVCQTPYLVQRRNQTQWNHLGSALSPRRWLQTALIVITMLSAVGGAAAVCKLYHNSGIRLFAVSSALLVLYICFRFLGVNTVMAYQRTRIAGFSILDNPNLSTTSNHDGATNLVTRTVTVEVTPKAT